MLAQGGRRSGSRCDKSAIRVIVLGRPAAAFGSTLVDTALFQLGTLVSVEVAVLIDVCIYTPNVDGVALMQHNPAQTVAQVDP